MVKCTLNDSDVNKLLDFIESKVTWKEMTTISVRSTGFDSDEVLPSSIYRIYVKLSVAAGRTNDRLTGDRDHDEEIIGKD